MHLSTLVLKYLATLYVATTVITIRRATLPVITVRYLFCFYAL